MKFTRSMKIALLSLALVPVNAHSSELVAGSYDQKNDWMVFQWSNPEYGLRTATLDSGNKVKPIIHASVLPDGSGGFLYAFEIGVAQDFFCPAPG